MKNLLIALTVVAAATRGAEAAPKNRGCRTQTNCCQTTRWYKAKDGTYREMLPYAKALSRAEDADDLEISLKAVKEELAASQAAVEAAKAEAAAMKAELESRIAALEQQVEAERQQAAAQTERAEKAEAAHKLSVETVAQLRDDSKRQEEALTMLRGELKTVTEDRDAVKAASADLETRLNEAIAARDAAEEARKRAEEELQKVKQAATETKKPEVQEEQPEESPNPAGGNPE